jgi:hypothetical protein
MSIASNSDCSGSANVETSSGDVSSGSNYYQANFNQKQSSQKSKSKNDTSSSSSSKPSKRPKILKLNMAINSCDSASPSSPTSSNDQTPTFKCVVCTLPFNSAAKLLMHQHKYHKNGSSMQCPICCK